MFICFKIRFFSDLKASFETKTQQNRSQSNPKISISLKNPSRLSTANSIDDDQAQTQQQQQQQQQHINIQVSPYKQPKDTNPTDQLDEAKRAKTTPATTFTNGNHIKSPISSRPQPSNSSNKLQANHATTNRPVQANHLNEKAKKPATPNRNADNNFKMSTIDTTNKQLNKFSNKENDNKLASNSNNGYGNELNGIRRKMNVNEDEVEQLDEEINDDGDAEDLDESKHDEIDADLDELNEESALVYNGFAHGDEVAFNEDDDNAEAYTEYDEDHYDENNNYLANDEYDEDDGDDDDDDELNENQDEDFENNAYYASKAKANNLQPNKHILNSNSASSLVSISNLKTSHSLFGANNKVASNRASNGGAANKNSQLLQAGKSRSGGAQKAKPALDYDENSNNSAHNVEFAPKLSQSSRSGAAAASNSVGLVMSSSGTKHSCHICKKTFKTQNILRQHMRIHTGDKPFSCDICNKSFSQMASLKYHLATHSDDRPFRCDNCSKTFKLKPPYKKHIKECSQPRHASQKHQPSSSSSNASSSSVYYSNQLNNASGLNVDMNDDDE